MVYLWQLQQQQQQQSVQAQPASRSLSSSENSQYSKQQRQQLALSPAEDQSVVSREKEAIAPGLERQHQLTRQLQHFCKRKIVTCRRAMFWTSCPGTRVESMKQTEEG